MVDISNLSQLSTPASTATILGAETPDAANPSLYTGDAVSTLLSNSGKVSQNVASMATLRTLPVKVGTYINLTGFYAPGDGGEGLFVGVEQSTFAGYLEVAGAGGYASQTSLVITSSATKPVYIGMQISGLGIEPGTIITNFANKQGVYTQGNSRYYVSIAQNVGSVGSPVQTITAKFVDNGGTIILPTGGDGSTAWMRVYTGPVNVKWFGARGSSSSTSDDANAIQAAANCVDFVTSLSDGKPTGVYAPKGTYRTTKTISFINPTKFYGDGQQLTSIMFDPTADDTCLFFGRGSEKDNVAYNGYILPDPTNVTKGILTVVAGSVIGTPIQLGSTVYNQVPENYKKSLVLAGTVIESQSPGTSGGAGTYQVSLGQSDTSFTGSTSGGPGTTTRTLTLASAIPSNLQQLAVGMYLTWSGATGPIQITAGSGLSWTLSTPSGLTDAALGTTIYASAVQGLVSIPTFTATISGATLDVKASPAVVGTIEVGSVIRAPAANFMGRIDNGVTPGVAGTTLTVTDGATLAVGQYITGPDVQPNTRITANLSATTWTVSISQTVGSASGSSSPIEMVANYLPLGTTITAFGTGTGGAGTYKLSAVANVPTNTVMTVNYDGFIMTNNILSDMRIFAYTTTYTKIAVDMKDLITTTVENMNVGADGTFLGNQSIAFRLRGRDSYSFRNLRVGANRPFVFGRNVNYPSLSLDQSNFHNIFSGTSNQVLGESHFFFEPGANFSSVSWTGYQSWTYGRYGIYYDNSTLDPAGASYALSVNNVRMEGEEGKDDTGYVYYFDQGSVSSVQDIKIENNYSTEIAQGYYFKGCDSVTIINSVWGSTRKALEFVRVSGNEFLQLINCFWQAGSTASLLNFNLSNAVWPSNTTSPLPKSGIYSASTSLWSRDLNTGLPIYQQKPGSTPVAANGGYLVLSSLNPIACGMGIISDTRGKSASINLDGSFFTNVLVPVSTVLTSTKTSGADDYTATKGTASKVNVYCEPPAVNMNAVITNNVLTASTVTGTIVVGMNIFLTNVPAMTQIVSQVSGTPGGAGDYNVTPIANATATVAWGLTTFTGSIAGTTLATSSVVGTALSIGQPISGPGVAAGTYIVSGAGPNYTVNISQNVASTTMYMLPQWMVQNNTSSRYVFFQLIGSNRS